MTVLPKKLIGSLMVFLFSETTMLYAQEDSSLPAQQTTTYVGSYWHNGLGIIKSPVRWRADDWVKAGATAAVTGLIISMDEAISQPVFDWNNQTGRAVGDGGFISGGVPFNYGISGLAIGAGAISHNNKLRNFGLDNLQAQIFTTGITVLAKELFQRSRPRTGEGAYQWNGPFNGHGNDTKSFFSGHSSLTFSTATMVFLYSKKKWWVGVLSYGFATGVSVSRLQRQAHWASDVVLGAVVGTAVSSYVYKQQQKRREVRKTLLKPLP